MVRHVRRSMAIINVCEMWPIKTQNSVRQRNTPRNFPPLIITFIVCIIFLMQLSWAFESLHYTNDDLDEMGVGVGNTAHEPRFGERLLPLRKKKIMSIAAATTAPTTTTTTTTTTTVVNSASVVNNLLNKNNYIVSQEVDEIEKEEYEKEENLNENQKEIQIKNNENPNEINVKVKRKNQLHAYSNQVTKDHAGADPNSFTLTVATLDNETFESITAAPRRRQPKQLNRREDVDIVEPANVVMTVNSSNSSSSSISNVSKADRLVEMSTEFFVVPTTAASSVMRNPLPMPNSKIHSKARGLPNFIQPSMHPPYNVAAAGTAGAGQRSVLIVAPKTNSAGNSSATPPTIIATHANFTGLRKEPWVVPVLVLASLTMIMMAAFEIFVLFKAWRTSPSRRHLFLGQMLLLGLFACAGLGAIITAQPSLLSCGAMRFGVGVAYALVFAALLVKCVFLISLNGGVYLPAPYQGLLLLFAVLIQVAIGAQWLLTNPPEIYTMSVPLGHNTLLGSTMAAQANGIPPAGTASTFTSIFQGTPTPTSDLYARIAASGTVLIPLCKTQYSEFLFSLIYIIFLIVFVAVLAIKSRGIRDNYREATYIGLAIGGAIPIWLGWMLCGLAVAERHKDACIAFGLVATSATVFLVMFMPKGRQLAAMGKEGLYVEDREEQFSSLSRGGSGYSPSFFHFKPIKYGVMGSSGGRGGGGGAGLFQDSMTNAGNAANLKHHAANGLNAGDRVALVTAAPPSYTRMYHYFPAHLTTHPFCFYPQPPPPPPPPLQAQPPHGMTQLPAPPTLKHMGNSLSSMTQAQIAQNLRYPGLFIRPDETNLYTTLEPTLSTNPNVYFQRSGAVHPGMMY